MGANRPTWVRIPPSPPIRIHVKTQSKIAALIQESFALQVESKRLLEIAKRAIEIAIEQSEKIAMKFLLEETKRNTHENRFNLYINEHI